MISFVFIEISCLNGKKLNVTTPQFMWIRSHYTITWNVVYLHLVVGTN